MKFNLKQYLTEKLLSSIIINELLNDKGGLCKYYKIKYKENSNHLYDKIYRIYKQLNKIFFNELHDIYRDEINRKTYNAPSDQLYIKAYNNYMKLFEQYLKLFVRLFKDPSVDILSCFLRNPTEYFDTYRISANILNISNLTDDMFLKYTYQLIKNDKILYNDIINKLKSDDGITIFWMRYDKTILAISRNNTVRIVAPFLYNNTTSGSLENFQNFTSNKDNAIIRTYTNILDDGTTLIWPIVESHYYDNKSDIFSMISHANISMTDQDTHFKRFDVGKFLSKASQLYKNTKWGDNVNDYIIIYGNDIQNLMNSKYTYINYKIKKNNRNPDRLKDVNVYVDSKFKWLRDIFGDIIPYRQRSTKKDLYSFMSKFDEYQYSKEYNADAYCIKLFNINQSKYNAIKLISSNTKKLKNEITLKYNELLNNINIYLKFSKDMINYIKNSDDIKIINEIVPLYSAYSYILNEILTKCNDILKSMLTTKENNDNAVLNSLNLSATKTEWELSHAISLLNASIENTTKLLDEVSQYYSPMNKCKQNLENLINQE